MDAGNIINGKGAERKGREGKGRERREGGNGRRIEKKEEREKEM